jgi:hypothetical protein
VFRETEVPEDIVFGGTQKLAVHELIGGGRQVDAMGRREKDLDWGGLILGPDAMDRAFHLENLRVQGNPLTLTWGRLNYLVAIEEFLPKYQRFYQIPYTIRCVVINNNTAPVPAVDNAGVDDAISEDMTTAEGQVSAVGDSTLSGLFTTFQGAVNGVASFVNIAASVAATVLQSLEAVQARLVVLQAMAESSILGQPVIGVGGTLPAITVGAFAAAIAAVQQEQVIVALAGVLGRIGWNVGAVCQSSGTVVTAGGDLFQIAAQTYGQAQAWTTIAAANRLADPVLQGIQTLNVPDQPDGNDGVLES